ncbi:MAG: 4-aminobutyrate--2-oxoglutarate transaminase [Deltaproteobacteria bacterium]|nr:4-aminobutyrate--2-oxoglutarate transaminase [Deltaproteobacteria bacterium]
MELGKKTEELTRIRNERIPKGVFNITPFFAASARGALIIDVEGREFIDFAGGIGAQNVGHCHPKVVAAIKDQAEKYIHPCFHVMMYAPYVELAEKLCALAPGDSPKMTMFANSGAEAVENAVKAARYFTKRAGIIAFDCAFHGRTLMSMTLTSKNKPFKLGFGPYAPEVYRMAYAYCYRCPFGLNYPGCQVFCASHLEDFFINNVAAENIAALLIEPLAGEGGFITPPPEYFPKLMEICRKNGIVFIADEIQTGMARTGRYFAIEHWDVVPDVITVAKSLAAGMPLSGVIGRAEIMDAPHSGGLGGTYSGNPVACRAALAVLDIIEEESLLQKAEELGHKIKTRFDSWQKQYSLIGEVRGKGPMLAMELVKDRNTKTPAADEAKALVKYCYERGLIVLSCGNYGNVIRTLMPIIITDAQLEKGLAILEEGLAALPG